MSSSDVPVFKLYGENKYWPTPDLLHCESIPERSSLYDWRIHPHRHADLVHLLYVSAGEVEFELEGSTRQLSGPLVIVVPAMSIHGFRFSPDIQGNIITLARPLAEYLNTRLVEQGAPLTHVAVHRLEQKEETTPLATLVEQIADEYRYQAVGREHMLEALTLALSVELARLTRRNRQFELRRRDRGREHLQNYQALIERLFQQQPSIEQLAGQLGMTSAHLNTLCRQMAGRSALQLLHERVLLEAKRKLTYTNMTISEIADTLGFSEPAYFTRFFKRLTSFAPRNFRLRQRAE